MPDPLNWSKQEGRNWRDALSSQVFVKLHYAWRWESHISAVWYTVICSWAYSLLKAIDKIIYLERSLKMVDKSEEEVVYQQLRDLWSSYVRCSSSQVMQTISVTFFFLNGKTISALESSGGSTVNNFHFPYWKKGLFQKLKNFYVRSKEVYEKIHCLSRFEIPNT